MAIIAGLLSIVFYFILVNVKAEVQSGRIAPVSHRAAAFAIDFWFSVFTLGSLLALMPLLFEAQRTGVFRWYFQRDYAAFSDQFEIVLVPAGLCVFVAYFVWPLMKGSQTVGCWLLRLATVDDNGNVVYLPLSSAMRRVFWEFRGLTSPIKSFRARDAEGRTFYDLKSGFTVMRY